MERFPRADKMILIIENENDKKANRLKKVQKSK